MLSMRSIGQKAQLKEARKKRHSCSDLEEIIPLTSGKISSREYCLACLSEGLGETQARRFLSKLRIKCPSQASFYRAQSKILKDVEELSEESMQKVRKHLLPGTIFSSSCLFSKDKIKRFVEFFYCLERNESS